MKKYFLLLILLVIVGCGNIDTSSIDEVERIETVDEYIESDKEDNKVDRKCIIGEIISVEDDYIYIRGAEDICYNVYTENVSKYTVGYEVYVYYDVKKNIGDNLYMIEAERVDEAKPEREIPKL